MSTTKAQNLWRSLVTDTLFFPEKHFSERVHSRLALVRRYFWSQYHTRDGTDLFDKVQVYCAFVGHARSGGTIIAGLLDAHPNMIISDEQDVLQYLPVGFSREQIFRIILDRSEIQERRGRTKPGRAGKTYSYYVPDQWQGRYSELLGIGDAKAGFTTQRIARDPSLIDALQQKMAPIPVKFLHAVRNPYDTISTMNIRSGRPLTNGIERYFVNCLTLDYMWRKLGDEGMFLVRNEKLVFDPQGMLRSLCDFLGLEAPDSYIEDAASIIYNSPAHSRTKVDWPPELIDQVAGLIEKFDFLDGYSFDT